MNGAGYRCTDEITCPYCGCEVSDSSELVESVDDEGIYGCDECGKEYNWYANVSLTFSTYKKVLPAKQATQQELKDG